MLPDYVLQIIKEYYKTIQNQYLSNTLLEDLQIFIVQKWFSYDRFVHLKLEYKLIQKYKIQRFTIWSRYEFLYEKKRNKRGYSRNNRNWNWTKKW